MELVGQQKCAEKEGGFSLQNWQSNGKAVLSRAKNRTLRHSEAKRPLDSLSHLWSNAVPLGNASGNKIWADSIDENQTSDLNWWMQYITLPQIIFSQFFILTCFEKSDRNGRDTHSGSCVWPVGSCFIIISVIIIGCQTLDLEKCLILFCESNLNWPLRLLRNYPAS